MKKLSFLAFIGILAMFISSCAKDQLAEESIDPVRLYGINTKTREVKTTTVDRNKPASISSLVTSRSATISANGHFNVYNPIYETASISYTFSAVQNKGGVQGHVNLNALIDEPDIFDFDMDTECIVVEGNRATVGGVITQVTKDGGYIVSCGGCPVEGLPFFAVGNSVYFAVEDNGEGAKDPSDKVASVIWIGFPEDPSLCEILPPSSPAWEFFGPWQDTYLPSDQIQVNQ